MPIAPTPSAGRFITCPGCLGLGGFSHDTRDGEVESACPKCSGAREVWVANEPPCRCCGAVDWLAWPLVDGGLDHFCLTCGEFRLGGALAKTEPPTAQSTIPSPPPSFDAA